MQRLCQSSLSGKDVFRVSEDLKDRAKFNQSVDIEYGGYTKPKQSLVAKMIGHCCLL